MVVDMKVTQKSEPSAGRRPRNSEATRQAILESALSAFVRAGYDGVGVREIAGGAGVDAMLVNRYFGSKEELFAEAVDAAHSGKGILTSGALADPDLDALAQRLARALVDHTSPDTEALSGFLLSLRSAGNPRAAEILRKSIAHHFEHPLGAMLEGPGKAARIALLLSIISGVQAMRQVIGIQSFDSAHPDHLVGMLSGLIRPLLDPNATARRQD